MEQILNVMTDTIKYLGATLAIVLAIILFIVIVALLYGWTVLESHLQYSSLSELFKRGRFEVTMNHQHTHESQTVVVTAMNKIAAIEKVAKNRQDLQHVTFTAERIQP